MDKKILIDAIHGNSKSLEKIISQNQTRIYAFVKSKVNNSMDVDEIVQETFINCLINIGKLQKIETFDSWLFKLCHNKIKNYYRDKREDVEFNENVNITNEIKNEWNNYTDLLKVSISTLSRNQRDVLQLYYFSGHSYLEISKICNISLIKVKSRLYEAKQILKSKIPHLYHGVELTKSLMNTEKELIMKELELIKIASSVIRSLSLKDQMELCLNISNSEKISGKLLENISEIEFGKDFLKGYNSRLTVRDLSKIITYDKVLDKWLINNLEKIEPQITEEFKKNIFVFEDIVLLPPSSVELVLKNIKYETIITAISSTEKVVKQYILSFFDNEEKEQILNLFLDISSLDTDINRAQFSIVERIRELHDDRIISFSFDVKENLRKQGL
ncbi:MAG: sigma-70 family RNA polymerase sigma factor [Spirochaetaceae bacterium]